MKKIIGLVLALILLAGCVPQETTVLTVLNEYKNSTSGAISGLVDKLVKIDSYEYDGSELITVLGDHGSLNVDDDGYLYFYIQTDRNKVQDYRNHFEWAFEEHFGDFNEQNEDYTDWDEVRVKAIYYSVGNTSEFTITMKWIEVINT